MISSNTSAPKVVKISSDPFYLDCIGDTLTIKFKISDEHEFEIKCPVENFRSASKLCEGIVTLLETGCLTTTIEETKRLGLTNHKFCFDVLSQYLNDGFSKSLNSITLEKIKERDLQAQENCKDLGNLYKLADYLDIEELKVAAEDKILEIIEDYDFNYEKMKGFLSFGIKYSMKRTISFCFPLVLGTFWSALRTNAQQLQLITRKLIEFAIPNLKEKDQDLTIVQLTGNCLKMYSQTRTCTYYVLPKEIQEIFPKLEKIEWHYKAGCLDFDRSADLKVKQFDQGPFLVQKHEKDSFDLSTTSSEEDEENLVDDDVNAEQAVETPAQAAAEV